MIKLNNAIVPKQYFPDGSQLFNAETFKDCDFSWGEVVGFRTIITWNYENDEEMATLYFLTRHLQEHGAQNIILVLDYIPNARMDRVKSNTDIFTLKYFAEFINSLNFSEVNVLDPHSNVSTALIDRVRVRSPRDFIKTAIEKCKPDVLFYPDEGAMKRYADLVKCDCGRAFGIKTRDWATGQIKGLEVHGDDVAGKNVLIIDDICSRGGTFYHSALKLKELGANNIYLFITHCENTIFEGELLKDNGLITKIYTTDSIFNKSHEKIEVFKI